MRDMKTYGCMGVEWLRRECVVLWENIWVFEKEDALVRKERGRGRSDADPLLVNIDVRTR